MLACSPICYKSPPSYFQEFMMAGIYLVANQHSHHKTRWLTLYTLLAVLNSILYSQLKGKAKESFY